VRRSVALLFALLLCERSAHAEESPVGRSAIGGDLLDYYDSERTTGILFASLGVASAAAGSLLLTRSGGFEKGLGGSMLALGGLEMIGGTFYAFQVGSEIRHFRQALASDPAAFKIEEGAHIHGTISRFLFYRVSELVVAAAGVGLASYGFASKNPGWQGIGIGVAGEALSLFALDFLGQFRARSYERRIYRYDPAIALSIGGGDRPWGLGFLGRF
jgi:hypothetical protein